MSDSNWSQVALLAKFNGANDSTEFLDEKRNFLLIPGGAVKVSTAQSKFGGASAFFGGVSDYLTLQSSPKANFGVQDFTLECWVRPGLLTSNMVLLAKNSSDVAGAFRFYITSAGEVCFEYMDSSPAWQTVTTTSSGLVVGAWSHLAVCRVGNDYKIYVDGVVKASATIAGSVPDLTEMLSVGLKVSGNTWYYSGYMDEMRVTVGVSRYSSAFTPPAAAFDTGVVLSADTVVVASNTNALAHIHFEEAITTTSLLDSGYSCNPILVSGAVLSPAQQKFGSKSLYLPAVGAHLLLRGETYWSNAAGDDFFFEGWVRFNALSTRAVVIGKANSSTENVFQLYVETTGALVFTFGDATASAVALTITSDPGLIRVGLWQHVAVGRSGNVMRIFVDGVIVGVGDCTGLSMYYWAAVPQIKLGYDGVTPANGFVGYLDEFRFITKECPFVESFITQTAPHPDPVVTEADSQPAYDTEVKFLASFDAEDGQTNHTVNKAYTTAILFNSGVVVSSAQKKFGTHSLLMSGGTYAYSPQNTDLDLNGDFTIEFWVYMQNTSAGNTGILTTQSAIGGPGWRMEWYDYLSFNIGFSPTVSLYCGVVPLNEWHHIAISRTGSSLRSFRDGVPVSDIIYGTAIPSGTNLILGGVPFLGGTNPSGHIDEMRITVGVGRYSARFKPQTQPYSCVKPSQLSLPLYWNETVFLLQCEVVNGSQYLRDEKGFFRSAGGSPLVSGAVPKFGAASCKFDGTAASAVLAITPSIGPISGQYMFECWFYPLVVGIPVTLFCVSGTKSQIHITALGYVTLYANGNTYQCPNPFNFAPNHWYLIQCGRSSAGNFHVFINGNWLGGVSAPSAWASSTVYCLGASAPSGSATAEFVNGYIDSVRLTRGAYRDIFGRSPPTEQFPNNYQSDPHWNNVSCLLPMLGKDGGGTFYDVKGKTVTKFGTPTTDNGGGNRFGEAFNSTSENSGSYLTLDAHADFSMGTGDFTLEVWVYQTQRSSTLGTHLIEMRGDTTGTPDGPYIIITTAGKLQTPAGTGTITISLNTYHHLAFSRVGGNFYAFVDGVLDLTTATISDYASANSLKIGTSYNRASTTNLVGWIDSVRITKGVGRYSANFTPPSGEFPWHRAEKLSGVVYDVNGNPVSRTVRAHRRSDGAVSDTQPSSAIDGTFSLEALDYSEHYVLVMDSTANALIYDHVLPA